MNARGWGWTASEIRQAQLIEWLAEQSAGQPNLFIEVKSFYDAIPQESRNKFEVAYADLKQLEEQGLVNQASGLGGIEALAAMLTPHGHDFLGKLRSWRANRLQRRTASRDALVAWLYSVDATNTANLPVRNAMLDDSYSRPILLRPLSGFAIRVWLRALRLIKTLGPFGPT
jgi:hypothetical protein